MGNIVVNENVKEICFMFNVFLSSKPCVGSAWSWYSPEIIRRHFPRKCRNVDGSMKLSLPLSRSYTFFRRIVTVFLLAVQSWFETCLLRNLKELFFIFCLLSSRFFELYYCVVPMHCYPCYLAFLLCSWKIRRKQISNQMKRPFFSSFTSAPEASPGAEMSLTHRGI